MNKKKKNSRIKHRKNQERMKKLIQASLLKAKITSAPIIIEAKPEVAKPAARKAPTKNTAAKKKPAAKKAPAKKTAAKKKPAAKKAPAKKTAAKKKPAAKKAPAKKTAAKKDTK